MRGRVCCCDEATNYQLPIAAAGFVILHLSTFKEHRGSTLYCLAWRSVLVMDNNFPFNEHRLHGLDLAATFSCVLWAWRTK